LNPHLKLRSFIICSFVIVDNYVLGHQVINRRKECQELSHFPENIPKTVTRISQERENQFVLLMKVSRRNVKVMVDWPPIIKQFYI
jgi:hypothetical protein